MRTLCSRGPWRWRRLRHVVSFRAPAAPVNVGLAQRIQSIEEARKKVRQRLDDLEGQARQQRVSEGRTVLGRAGVLRQDFRACPDTWEPRRKLRPTIAARSRWARVEALQRDRAFQEAYQVALKAWLAGLPAVFPKGTYKLRGKPGVVIQE